MAKKKPKTWVYSPLKPPKPSVPDDIKAAVEAKAIELIDTVLKPKHITTAEEPAVELLDGP